MLYVHHHIYYDAVFIIILLVDICIKIMKNVFFFIVGLFTVVIQYLILKIARV